MQPHSGLQARPQDLAVPAVGSSTAWKRMTRKSSRNSSFNAIHRQAVGENLPYDVRQPEIDKSAVGIEVTTCRKLATSLIRCVAAVAGLPAGDVGRSAGIQHSVGRDARALGSFAAVPSQSSWPGARASVRRRQVAPFAACRSRSSGGSWRSGRQLISTATPCSRQAANTESASNTDSGRAVVSHRHPAGAVPSTSTCGLATAASMRSVIRPPEASAAWSARSPRRRKAARAVASR